MKKINFKPNIMKGIFASFTKKRIFGNNHVSIIDKLEKRQAVSHNILKVFYSTKDLQQIISEIIIELKHFTQSEVVKIQLIDEKNRTCNDTVYKSVVQIPIHSGLETVGLLQLCDSLPDKFSVDDIQFIEEIGNFIGFAYDRMHHEALMSKQINDLKNENNEYIKRNEVLNENIICIKSKNEELQLLKIKAEESDNLKSTFLTNISHEIRTQLNAMMGFSESLLRVGLSREKLEKYVHIIIASGQQLLSVISDIIDISKIENGQISIDLDPIDINNLMNDIYITYKNTVNFENVRFQSVLARAKDSVVITTDGDRLKQILCNLINNAIKFTKKGDIEFGYKIEGNMINFYVKDTGVGISAENFNLIFQRFSQIDQNYGGNGLGLPISKALIEKMGGAISVNSHIGKGSVFTFTLPYLQPNELVINPSHSHDLKNVNYKDSTILIVEDNMINQTYVDELLSVTQSTLIHARNGYDAVESVKEHSEISLILMDIKMPVMDGLEATRLIKKIRPNLPIIAQTAYAMGEDRKQAIEAGCDYYLTKPLDKYLLNKILSHYLSEQHTENILQ